MQAQAWAPPAAVDANTFRIFISTDNHLGYHEKHEYPPRQDDSFRAVEEVLKNATAAKVSGSPNAVFCVQLSPGMHFWSGLAPFLPHLRPTGFAATNWFAP